MLVMWECNQYCGDGERCIIAVDIKDLSAYDDSLSGLALPEPVCLFSHSRNVQWIQVEPEEWNECH